MIQQLQGFLDHYLNGETRGHERRLGFVMLVYPYDAPGRGKYVSNGKGRSDVIEALKGQLAQFEESQP